MRFADSLKAYDPEKQKQELLKVLEDDPRAFAKAIASHAEAAVRRDAAIAAQNKRNSISGYLVYQGMYDADPYYRLEPKALKTQKIPVLILFYWTKLTYLGLMVLLDLRMLARAFMW